MIRRSFVPGIVSIVIAALPMTVAASDLLLSYQVDAKALKAAPAGTSLAATIYSDSTCTTSVSSTNVDVADLTIDAVKTYKIKGGTKKPKMARMTIVMTGVTPPDDTLYLKVTGTGVTALGGDCQVQAAGLNENDDLPCATTNGNNVIFEGCNVNVRNAGGATDSNADGLGNLIVGWNENTLAATRTGSNNLIVGSENEWTSYGCLVAGYFNTAVGSFSSITGGTANYAGGYLSSISGGAGNYAMSNYASVSGGASNYAGGVYSSVSGGSGNGALGDWGSISGGFANYVAVSGAYASISGGGFNQAFGYGASVSGGAYGEATGYFSSVSGGRFNKAAGMYAAVSGGSGNQANGYHSSISGGNNNITMASSASVTGGSYNSANGKYSSVSGGYQNATAYGQSSVSGGSQNYASYYSASVSGGYNNVASSVQASVSGGANNEARNYRSSVSGGNSNDSYGYVSSISGGNNNYTAVGAGAAAVSGGANRNVYANFNWKGGGYASAF